MFSSDYPHWDGDTPDFALRHLRPEYARGGDVSQCLRGLSYRGAGACRLKRKCIRRRAGRSPAGRAPDRQRGRQIDRRIQHRLADCGGAEYLPACFRACMPGPGQRHDPALQTAGQFIWGRENEILRCPWHGWEFDLNSGQCLTDRRRLKCFPVRHPRRADLCGSLTQAPSPAKLRLVADTQGRGGDTLMLVLPPCFRARRVSPLQLRI